MSCKKVIALLLSVLMLFTVVACAKNDQNEGNDGSGDSQGSVGTTSPFEDYELHVKDFDEYEFKILVSEGDYGIENYTVEDYNASALEAKIYSRNISIQDRLNIKISSETAVSKQVSSTIETLCGSGTFEYDCFSIQMTDGLPLVVKGYMAADSNMKDHIELSRPWWDEAATKQLAVEGINYTYIGDAVIHYFESMWVMAYNNEIAENGKLPNLAQLALDGGWTLEVLNQYIEQAYVDTDNSASKTDGDILGATIPNTFVQAIG